MIVQLRQGCLPVKPISKNFGCNGTVGWNNVLSKIVEKNVFESFQWTMSVVHLQGSVGQRLKAGPDNHAPDQET